MGVCCRSAVSLAARNLFMAKIYISPLQTMPKTTKKFPHQILAKNRTPKHRSPPVSRNPDRNQTRSSNHTTQKKSKTKLPRQITIRPRCHRNATPRLVPPITPAPSPWTHTAAATISDHEIEIGKPAPTTKTTTPIQRPLSDPMPPIRTRKLGRKKKRDASPSPHRRAALPSLVRVLYSTWYLGNPLEHTKNKSAGKKRGKKSPKSQANFSSSTSGSIRARLRRLREGSGGGRSSPIYRISAAGG